MVDTYLFFVIYRYYSFPEENQNEEAGPGPSSRQDDSIESKCNFKANMYLPNQLFFNMTFSLGRFMDFYIQEKKLNWF